MVYRNLGENYERCVADSVNLTATEKNSSVCFFFFHFIGAGKSNTDRMGPVCSKRVCEVINGRR